MKTDSPDYLSDLSNRIFQAIGSTPEEAEQVTEKLMEASLMGLDSHGVIRVPQYVEDYRAGKIAMTAHFVFVV